MPVKDPIRVVDRSALKVANLDRVSRAVQSDLKDMRRALKERFGSDFGSKYPDPSPEMVTGYASNVRAWLLNESRRSKETIVDLTTAGATKAVAQRWARNLSFQKGILDLSVASHPRAMQRISVLDFAESAGIEHMAMLVPSMMESHISLKGMLAGQVGKIRTIANWQGVTREVNKARKGLSLIFTLGMHHNDPHQMLPIPASLLSAAYQEMKRYRAALLRRIERMGRP